jgi:cellulose 1,4-beta-cellobiosidase
MVHHFHSDQVTYSNIKWGDIDSTYGNPSTAPGSTAPGSTTAPHSSTTAPHSTTPPTSTAPTSTPPASTGGGTVARYGQCGGTGYSGATTCASPYTCTAVSAPYYYQVLTKFFFVSLLADLAFSASECGSRSDALGRLASYIAIGA